MSIYSCSLKECINKSSYFQPAVVLMYDFVFCPIFTGRRKFQSILQSFAWCLEAYFWITKQSCLGGGFYGSMILNRPLVLKYWLLTDMLCCLVIQQKYASKYQGKDRSIDWKVRLPVNIRQKTKVLKSGSICYRLLVMLIL